MSSESSTTSFRDLSLIEPLLKALDGVGYETPSPIQAETIPHLLEGKDVLGQAQTGTGKTAAFALPLLSRIDLKQTRSPQVLVLAPTRELAIQVAEAFQRYAAHMKGFHVLPIYGGQDYKPQVNQLKRGVHVVVGTPGRIMDHMRRGTLKLGELSAMVLDEADEMLRMGFIDDVEWILEQTPDDRQIALFSATMPSVIRRIAQKHLNDPVEIKIKNKTATAENIHQRYWMVSGLHKLDALTRILEAETFDGIIIFVRTKTATVELADKLEARGYASAALNGDIPQNQRERTVNQLKSGKIDILIATDVVARGLDVERISHVINYDVPYDTESYVHRIGRTGRAGRKGDAILFISPREKRMLSSIERATKQKIDLMELPSTENINDKRIARFKQRITDTLAAEEDLVLFHQIIESYQQEHDIPAIEIASALAKLAQGDNPLLLKNKPVRERKEHERSERAPKERNTRDRAPKDRAPRERTSRPSEGTKARRPTTPEEGMQRYRIEVGREHGVEPRNIVGAITNEAGIDYEFIGRINIQDDHSIIDLPEGMPQEVFKTLGRTRVQGQQLRISPIDDSGNTPPKKSGYNKGENKSDSKKKPERIKGRLSFKDKKKLKEKKKPKDKK